MKDVIWLQRISMAFLQLPILDLAVFEPIRLPLVALILAEVGAYLFSFSISYLLVIMTKGE